MHTSKNSAYINSPEVIKIKIKKKNSIIYNSFFS